MPPLSSAEFALAYRFIHKRLNEIDARTITMLLMMNKQGQQVRRLRERNAKLLAEKIALKQQVDELLKFQ